MMTQPSTYCQHCLGKLLSRGDGVKGVRGNTRMRRWELVATRQFSELNKNTTVALEQNVPHLHYHPTLNSRRDCCLCMVLTIVEHRVCALMQHNMWNSIHTDLLVVE